MSPISLLLVDDHPIFVEGLRGILAAQEGLAVAGTADTIAGAVEQARALRPEIALLDLRLKDGSGLDALPDLLAASPETRVIVLTGLGEEHAVRARRLGARGFVSKDRASSHLLSAIAAVARGETWFDRAVVASPRSRSSPSPPAREEGALTPREQEVLRLVGEGKRNREIARTLQISEYTVRTHVSSLMRKLQIEDRLQLALYASQPPTRP